MPDFAPGQRWSYATRPGEPRSTVLILARDDSPGGGIVHIRVEGLRLRTPHGEQTELAHSPIAEASLRASVTALIETHVPLPGDLSGLRHWEAAFARGEAGAFTLSVAEIVGAVEQAVGSGPDGLPPPHTPDPT